MFGRDLKAEAKALRNDFVIEFTGRRKPLPTMSATIKEQVKCDNAKKGMHYVSVTLKNGHIDAFSCECVDTVDRLSLQIERDSREGSGNSCYDVYLNLAKYIQNYVPDRWSAREVVGGNLIPILAPIVKGVRHTAYTDLQGARSSYARLTETIRGARGDYSLPRIYKTAYLLRKLLNNSFDISIFSMFDIKVITEKDDRHVGLVYFKNRVIFIFDEYLHPTHSKEVADSAILTAEKFILTRISDAALYTSTKLEDGTECLFCGDGKVYSRMKGHLARDPHKQKEKEVVTNFFQQFLTHRASNLNRMMRNGLHKHDIMESKGFRQLVSTEVTLRATKIVLENLELNK